MEEAMFHPLWEDAGGAMSATGGVLVEAPPRGSTKSRISREVRQELMRIPCYFCGGVPENVDHLVPLSRGGTNRRKNLVSSCRLCNDMKGSMFYRELITFCVEFPTTPFRGTSLRKVQRRQRWLSQAPKILAWHEARMKAVAGRPA